MRTSKSHNNTTDAAAAAASADAVGIGEMSSVMKSEISEDTSVTQSFINDTSLTGSHTNSFSTSLYRVRQKKYTVFRKKHPLTFSFISPWKMFRFS